jgi:thiamine transporter ThiT
MSKKTGALVIVLTGLVWGVTEIFLGDVFYRFHVPFRSATLTGLGLCLLVIGRLALDRPGSSLAAGVLSGFIRCLVPKVYICHAVAIAMEACAFDLTWSLLRAGERQTLRRAWLSGAVAIYSGLLAFGVVSLYWFKFGKWVAGGLPGVGLYALKSGSFAAVVFIVLSPLAVWAGRQVTARIPGLAEGRVHPPER